ncbi:uncharacterized protein SCHCODRAFT_02677222 [Schizophyllum commune H4-8]|uniref:Uncharacterized protein n=1 Tax=Schizophyllum commune (strain H4-8 / FGSC 9210) TaxID=578458 RepID=D8Q241_SCHCM|nr:uncharacterized protein SCHCODRAFT_02677222 [Schizophyllum commune H4-8]KAI5895703.1 hypothetical protein SCHCODRAFT_02677222 [Schizophyllum commune H4-8]
MARGKAKETRIDYTVSQGQRGRNPGIGKKLKRVQETGMYQILPPTVEDLPAHGADELGPQFPSTYTNYSVNVASVADLRVVIEEFNERNVRYGIDVTYNLNKGSLEDTDPLEAPNLVSFSIKAENLDAEKRAQVGELLNIVTPQNLVYVRLSLLGGRPTKALDTSVFDFLGRPLSTLTHVSLELSFCYKAGLLEYLVSDAAAHLVSLELQTNSAVADIIFEALRNEDYHALPNLQRLCLRLKVLPVDRLFEALKLRHDHGLRDPLRVEIVQEVDPDIRERAFDLGVRCPITGAEENLYIINLIALSAADATTELQRAQMEWAWGLERGGFLYYVDSPPNEICLHSDIVRQYNAGDFVLLPTHKTYMDAMAFTQRAGGWHRDEEDDSPRRPLTALGSSFRYVFIPLNTRAEKLIPGSLMQPQTDEDWNHGIHPITGEAFYSWVKDYPVVEIHSHPVSVCAMAQEALDYAPPVHLNLTPWTSCLSRLQRKWGFCSLSIEPPQWFVDTDDRNDYYDESLNGSTTLRFLGRDGHAAGQ